MKNKYILAFILLLSLILGIIGIDWGLPNTWTSDELMGSVLSMGKNRDLNPHEFKTPSLQRYIVFAALVPYCAIIKNKFNFYGDDYSSVPKWFISQVYILGRFVSLLMFCAAVLFTYLGARLIYNETVGLLAALFLSTSMIFVLYSHFAHVNAVVFWICMTLFLALYGHKTGKIVYVFLAGFSAGLVTSTRYLFPIIFVALFSGYLIKKTFRTRMSYVKIASFVFLFFAIGFILGTPFAILSAKEFVAGIVKQISEVSVFKLTNPGLLNLGIIANIRNIPEAIGWPYALLFIVSLVYSWALVIKKKDFNLLIVNSWILIWYLTYSCIHYNPVSHILFIAPAIAITNAILSYDLMSNKGLLGGALKSLITVIIVASLIYSLASDVLMVRDSRYKAAGWIKRNILKTEKIEEYGWWVKDVLPYHPSVPEGHRLTRIAYKDLPEHFRRLMSDRNFLPDWIIDSSFHYERYLNNKNFPVQSEFYAALFNAKLPYTLAADFKTQLALPKWLTPNPEFVNPRIVIFKLKKAL